MLTGENRKKRGGKIKTAETEGLINRLLHHSLKERVTEVERSKIIAAPPPPPDSHLPPTPPPQRTHPPTHHIMEQHLTEVGCCSFAKRLNHSPTSSHEEEE